MEYAECDARGYSDIQNFASTIQFQYFEIWMLNNTKKKKPMNECLSLGSNSRVNDFSNAHSSYRRKYNFHHIIEYNCCYTTFARS